MTDTPAERLAAMLRLCAAEATGNPDWVFDEWPLDEWAKEPQRAEFIALAERMIASAGLMARPADALLQAVAEAEKETTAIMVPEPMGSLFSGDVLSGYARALLALGRAVAELAGAGREK